MKKFFKLLNKNNIKKIYTIILIMTIICEVLMFSSDKKLIFMFISMFLVITLLILDRYAKKNNIAFCMSNSRIWVSLLLMVLYIINKFLNLNLTFLEKYSSIIISLFLTNVILKIFDINDKNIENSKIKVMVYSKITETLDEIIKILVSISIYNGTLIDSIFKRKY